ncbi:MAG: hypothetical protein Q9219_001587 [cf. Caloplaca sp. 3 TL-2023]
MEPQPGLPQSPSAILHSPISPNSWTVRSFTTLRPSDSPSQAQFPKQSQGSLLLGTQTPGKRTHNSGRKKIPETTEQHQQQQQQVPFPVGDRKCIVCAVLFQLSLLGITTMLALIIQAASSKPPKHIQPSYYIIMIVACTIATVSMIIGCTRWKERKATTGETSRRNQRAIAPNQTELGLALSPLPTGCFPQALLANGGDWGEPHANPAPVGSYHMRALMADRCNPQPAAPAHVAGPSNRQFHPSGQTDQEEAVAAVAGGLELGSFRHQQRHLHLSATPTALQLQHLLAAEYERQELLQRHVSAWLQNVSPAAVTAAQGQAFLSPPAPSPSPPPTRPLSSPGPPPPPPPPERKLHYLYSQRSKASFGTSPVPSNPAHLAQLDREGEANLGVPAPSVVTIPEEHKEETESPILPPTSLSRNNPLPPSGPTTVLHVGPPKPKPERSVQGKGGEAVGLGISIRGGGGGGEQGEGERVDHFAERWMENVMAGVEVGEREEGRVGSWLRRMKMMRFWGNG